MADRRVEVVNRRALVTVGGASLLAPLVAAQVQAQTAPDRAAVEAALADILAIQASGDDAAAIGARAAKAANLSDLADPAEARANIGADLAENVSRTLSGTGAISEDLATVLARDPISIESYGAAAGDVENTLAVERAIAAASAQGRPIYLERDYQTQTLEIPSGTVVRAFKPGASFDILDDGSAQGRQLFLDGVETVLFDGVGIKSSNAAARTGVYGNVMLLGAENVVFRDCDFGKSSSVALWVGGASKRVQVLNSRVHDTLADGLHFTRGSEDILVFGNEVWNCGDDGIAFVGYIEGLLGVEHGPLRNCQAINNVVRDSIAAGSGVVFLGVIGGRAIGNRVHNTFLNGITVSVVGSGVDQTHYCRDIVIADNHIRDVSSGGTGFGISVQNARGVTLRDNSVRGSASHTLNLAGVVLDVTVEGGEYGEPTSGRCVYHSQIPSADTRLRQELYTDAGETAPATALSRNIRIHARMVAPTEDAVQIVGTSGNLIAGVDIGGTLDVASGTGFDGLQLSFCTRPVITSKFRKFGSGALSTGFGINLVSCDAARVVGVEAVGVGDSGLGLSGDCPRILIQGCSFENNTSFGVFDGGTTSGLAVNNFWAGNGVNAYQGLAGVTLDNNLS